MWTMLTLRMGYCNSKWKHLLCIFCVFWSRFDPNYWQGRKAKLSAHAFYPFLFPIARHLTFAPNVFFHICKIIKSPPNRLGNGEELWAAISERTFVIYCHWPESTFPETGERLFLASNFFLRLIFLLQICHFQPFLEAGGGGPSSNISKKRFPTSYLAIKHDWNVSTEKNIQNYFGQ